MRLQLHFQHSNLPSIIQCKNNLPLKVPNFPNGKKEKRNIVVKPIALQILHKSKKISRTELSESKKGSTVHETSHIHAGFGKGPHQLSESKAIINEKSSKLFVLGAVSVGVVLFLMGFNDENKALALGPEGPLMEEFWDNMRRYAIYALTVSTGVLWAVFQPIYELLKNPISAILILVIMGGSFYIVSQVVSAMVGITDFAYDYNY